MKRPKREGKSGAIARPAGQIPVDAVERCDAVIRGKAVVKADVRSVFKLNFLTYFAIEAL